MENKKYVYQLSLADGSVVTNECDGIFSVNSPEDPTDKVLINSAVLIKIIEIKPAEEVQEEPQAVVAEEILEENVICVDEDCNDCK